MRIGNYSGGITLARCWVLERPNRGLWRALPRVRNSVRRPQVFAVNEVERLLMAGCAHPKHRAFLMTVYGAGLGLRLGEACRLEPHHIDSARLQIRVEQGKGRKGRGRRGHRVAISPRRLLALDPQPQSVTFAWKDYADGARDQVMTLRAGEFVRRFCLHPPTPRRCFPVKRLRPESLPFAAAGV